MDGHRGGRHRGEQLQMLTVIEVDSYRGGGSQRWTVTEVDGTEVNSYRC